LEATESATRVLTIAKETTVKPRLLVLTALVGALMAALATPNPAAAHSTDQLHQHGWSPLTLAFSPNPMRCFGAGLYNGMGQISVAVPDFVTTPGGNQYVAYRAQLEYHNGSRWTDRVPDGRYLPGTNWNYIFANANGPLWAVWIDYTTRQYGPRGTIGYNITPGFAFRFRLSYYWFYDGRTETDVTSTCAVSSLTGAKATKKKKKMLPPTLGGRTRRPARIPAAAPALAIGG
jgi:hypothetical protein